jgi:hypothetical protein
LVRGIAVWPRVVGRGGGAGEVVVVRRQLGPEFPAAGRPVAGLLTLWHPGVGLLALGLPGIGSSAAWARTAGLPTAWLVTARLHVAHRRGVLTLACFAAGCGGVGCGGVGRRGFVRPGLVAFL